MLWGIFQGMLWEMVWGMLRGSSGGAGRGFLRGCSAMVQGTLLGCSGGRLML